MTIDDEAENRWLDTEAEMIGGRYWWFGATDNDPRTTAGDFIWIASGAHLASGYENWGRGQPDDWEGLGTYCGAFDIYQEGETGIPSPWHDAPCRGSFPFVCEAGP